MENPVIENRGGRAKEFRQQEKEGESHSGREKEIDTSRPGERL